MWKNLLCTAPQCCVLVLFINGSYPVVSLQRTLPTERLQFFPMFVPLILSYRLPQQPTIDNLSKGILNENSTQTVPITTHHPWAKNQTKRKEQTTKNALQSVSGRNWPQTVHACHYFEYHSLINDRCQSFWITKENTLRLPWTVPIQAWLRPPSQGKG
jgi:hypothetical protein